MLVDVDEYQIADCGWKREKCCFENRVLNKEKEERRWWLVYFRGLYPALHCVYLGIDSCLDLPCSYVYVS